MKATETTSLVGNMIAYERGEMTHEEQVAFFQSLIDTDLVWALQGSYGRTAKALIETGACKPKGGK